MQIYKPKILKKEDKTKNHLDKKLKINWKSNLCFLKKTCSVMRLIQLLKNIESLVKKKKKTISKNSNKKKPRPILFWKVKYFLKNQFCNFLKKKLELKENFFKKI